MATTIMLEIEDMLLARIVQEATTRNIGIPTFICSALTNALSQTDFPVRDFVSGTDMLDAAIRAVRRKKSGEEFFLKDIFAPSDWLRISSGERKSLGKEFRRNVENEGLAKHVGKTSSNQAIYQRI